MTAAAAIALFLLAATAVLALVYSSRWKTW